MTVVTKQCTRCKVEKPLAAFHFEKCRQLYRSDCRECRRKYRSERNKRPEVKQARNIYRRKAHQSNPDIKRSSRYRYKYGISLDDYNRMVEAQNGVCQICQRPPRKEAGHKLCIDHSHVTGSVRGLLCTYCNTLIGMAGERILTLEQAIEYLRVSSHV